MSNFLAFLFEKFLITLSKSTCLAMLDSMFNLARSTSRVCDVADRKFFYKFKLAEKSFSRCYFSWNCQEYSQDNTNICK